MDVACHNAADSSTISGPWDDVMKVIEEFKEKGVFVKAVDSSERAFHSRYIKVIGRRLEQLLKEVNNSFVIVTIQILTNILFAAYSEGTLTFSSQVSYNISPITYNRNTGSEILMLMFLNTL